MAILATDKSTSNIEPIPSGTQMARCVQMIHIGTLTEEIQGKETTRNLVRITFELPTITHVFDETRGAEPRLLSREFTLSMNSKSALRKFLDTWRGVPFTESESRSFDVTKLIGVPCMLSVGLKTSKSSGNQYNTIDSALAIPPGVNAPDQITESCEINFENIHEHWEKIPRFIVDKIKLVPEYANIDFEFPDFDEMDHDVDDTPTTMSTPKQTSPRQPIVPETPKMPF